VQHYDPLEAPDPEEWLELDEHERIELVLRPFVDEIAVLIKEGVRKNV
jgi:hypothetical protein